MQVLGKRAVATEERPSRAVVPRRGPVTGWYAVQAGSVPQRALRSALLDPLVVPKVPHPMRALPAVPNREIIPERPVPGAMAAGPGRIGLASAGRGGGRRA
ncbi:hypothetical protein GCM10010345_69820 [Streptomyces canarius]|uniref:Uncharacterized protein n=1 Tax=Streptomyces canarius TaxID=285453 RepID=A0ABQ3D347_9ACTN|nr:hypothetical protein GCM10010345_69820 [Streptomyces canarius]